MDTDTVQQEFENIGFEIVEIDERDVLLYELSDGSEEEDGQYAIVSDEDGRIPETMESPVIVSIYDDNDTFQWSVTLSSGEELKDLFLRIESAEELLETLQDIRHENIERYDTEMDSEKFSGLSLFMYESFVGKLLRFPPRRQPSKLLPLHA